MSQPKLFEPFLLGAQKLANRVVMAPLTRNRASAEGDVPTELMAQYYRQRAGAGLIVSEATQISPQGKGYIQTPGIYSDAQVAGWRAIAEAVHGAGGKIFAQLWHVGRISHVDLQPGGAAPVAPSALTARAKTFVSTGFVDTSAPRALETAEIPALIADYVRAAENAVLKAGLDGVEIHAANGYLLDQFLRDKTNLRSDIYGGSPENRRRLVLEIVDAVVGALGPGRVGLRLSPVSTFNDIADSDPQNLFNGLADALSSKTLAYLHVIEGETGGSREAAFDYAALKKAFGGVYLANNGYDRETAIAAIDQGRADLIAFGRPFIANPDLVARLAENAPLNALDPNTLYGGGAEGYVDYPALEPGR